MRSSYSNDLSVTPDGTHKQTKVNLGLIAQEELEIEKEHGYANSRDDMLVASENHEGNYGMAYQSLIPILVNAVKELSAKVAALEAA